MLNIEKAFDKIRWNIIDFMLMKKTFWINGENGYNPVSISSVQYSILINGRAKGRIKPTRGIRQGDCISPFIFVTAMDCLSRILQHLEQQRNKIKGIDINGFNLTHLLFTSDILLFVEDNDEYIINLQFSIHLFEFVSGLNINRVKPTISPINISKERVDLVADS